MIRVPNIQSQLQEAAQILGRSVIELRDLCASGDCLTVDSGAFKVISELGGFCERENVLYFIPARELREDWKPSMGSAALVLKLKSSD